MSYYNREKQYINLLAQGPATVKELSEKLFISEPTVRRDIILLQQKELITRNRGIVTLKTHSPDQRIPLFIRQLEQNEEKKTIAIKAASKIKDGDVIMLDASTTAFYILPLLTSYKKILIITNGAKTALEAVSMGIRTICTGGEMTFESFSYIGPDAEATLNRYNADIAFFSCRGISDDGVATDSSIMENNIRRIMIKNSKESYILCDKSKFSKTYLNTLCKVEEISGLISDI
ncbi:MAG: DeoR/GlpR transcriptional regulator [Clostridia bacterium]|nr:DeoR/GlpR transcriptional regulator [Clostridia bacterium]